MKLYLRAAQQGDLFGMFNVAMAYDAGEGLPFNPAQAAAWMYAALRLGHDYSIKQMSGSAELDQAVPRRAAAAVEAGRRIPRQARRRVRA